MKSFLETTVFQGCYVCSLQAAALPATVAPAKQQPPQLIYSLADLGLLSVFLLTTHDVIKCS